MSDLKFNDNSNKKEEKKSNKFSLIDFIKNWFNPPKDDIDKNLEESYVKMINLVNDDPENPYKSVNAILASMAYEHTKESYRDKKIARIFMTTSAIFLICTLYLATTVKVKPFVVGMNQNGQIFDLNSSLKDVNLPEIKNKLALFYANKFIKDVVSVSPDGNVNNENQAAAFATVRGAAANALKEYYEKNDAVEIAKKYTVHVDINYTLPVSDHTIRVDWTQTVRDVKTNSIQSQKKYVAEIVYNWDDRSGNELVQELNPLGFYVDHFTIEKDNT